MGYREVGGVIDLPVVEFDRKHPDAKCEECPLREVGKYVGSTGPPSTEIAIVGEAPGYHEVMEGEPFVGASGKLLNLVLKHSGIDRSKVFLTNACLCRPPDNGTPPKSAVKACRDRLDSELLARGATTVVALGNTASEALLDQTGVTRLRIGPGRPAVRLPGVHIISTIHPAACLRSADQFPNLVADFKKVSGSHVVWTPPEYIVADTEVDALHLLDQVERRSSTAGGGKDLLVIDIEVDVEKDIAFDHPNQYGMLCVGIGYAPRRVLVLSEGVMVSQQVRDRLGQLFQSRHVVAQNGKFDCAGLYPVIGGVTLYGDTMLASYAFDERPGVHSLEYQAVETLGAPDWKHELDKYNAKKLGYGVVPRPVLYKYNAYDVSCTWDLWEEFERKFKKHPEIRRVHDFLVAASNQLVYVELNGITIDREYLKELEVTYAESLDNMELDIERVVLRAQPNAQYDKRGVLNPRSPMQVKDFLRDQNIRVDSTNVDTLTLVRERVTGDAADFIDALLLHRREAKLFSTYIKGIRNRLYRGRVYPTFLLHGTTTGRLSCRNPNLQNIPRGSTIRRMFVPSREENVFVECDYAQAELRVLSFLAGDVYLRDIFNGGERDLFEELTAVLYPSSVPPVEGFSAPNEFAAWKELRIRVKAFVYGLSYGREAGSIASEFRITQREALQLQAKFFETIPEIVEFQKQTKSAVLHGEDLITPWGRHRRFPLITDMNKRDIMNEALAFLPQSTASDICLQAMTWAREELKGVAYIRNIVHDSILAECHKDDAEYVAATLDRLMVKSAQSIVGDYVDFKTEYKIGRSWGDV